MLDLSSPKPQFECKRCGSCCRSNSLIPLTIDDIYRIADFLGLHPDDFFANYGEEMAIAADAVPMPYLKREKGCPFLSDNLCGIHFVKPLLCRHMPSTIFGSAQYLRSKMPPGCALQQVSAGTAINDDDQIKERYMVSMILTSIYYSAHGTFIYDLAKPYIYRILLINKNRRHICDFLDEPQISS